ncbi:MAG: thiol peroxidase [Bacteroidales bacterium]|nr:thiol peroxidase [Bacteroidales bacterium]
MERNDQKVTFGGNPVTLLGDAARPGNIAPDFTVMDSDMKPVKLSDFNGKIKVLSVAPSIDTPVCANQTRTFNKEATKMNDNIAVLSISVDLPFALKRFCAAEGIDNVEALSDHKDVDFGTKYGFLIEEMRLLARGIVVIDKDNTIKYVEYVPEIGEEPNYQKALEEVRKLV